VEQRLEDDLLVQDVPKYSTNDVLGRDWREVVSDSSLRELKIRPIYECRLEIPIDKNLMLSTINKNVN